MFDYQAGEKFKLTLIMVGFAGLMAGMFFTMLVMPTPETTPHAKARPKWADNPDITGRVGKRGHRAIDGGSAAPPADGPGAAQAAEPGAAQAAASAYAPVDTAAGMNLMESWLKYAWDMSAQTARQSQTTAMQYMTPDCAAAYKQNVWNDGLAKQIEESGLQSTFMRTSVKSGPQQPDGSLIVYVDGQQVLQVPGGEQKVRPVRVEYMLKQTTDGIRIAGISEVGSGG